MPFSVEQKVLCKKIYNGRLLVDKLKERFTGPYLVNRVNENRVTYLVKDTSTQKLARVHHSQLKRFYVPLSYIADHPCYTRLQETSFSSGLPLKRDVDRLIRCLPRLL